MINMQTSVAEQADATDFLQARQNPAQENPFWSLNFLNT
jgi:hypothetical protein